MGLNQQYIKLCNVSIYSQYFFQLNRPVLFLIHGFASSTYTFNRLIPLLMKHFSIIAIDLPGFGKSEKSSSFVYSYYNYAKLVASCMDYFQLKEVTIVGHSMGGQIALYTTNLIPEKIKSLVLIASSGYLKAANKAMIYCTYLPFFRHYVKRKVKKKEVKDYLQNVFYNHSLITDDYIEEYGKPLREDGFYTSLTRLLRYREGDLTSEELRKIITPTLLLWGKEDKIVPVNIGYQLAKDLPNAKLIIYEKTGHLLTEERPKETFQHILTHLNVNNSLFS